MAWRPGEARCPLRRPGRLALRQRAEMAELDRHRRAGERVPAHAEARLRAADLPVPVPEVLREGPAERGGGAQRRAVLLADALDVHQESRPARDPLEDRQGLLAQLVRRGRAGARWRVPRRGYRPPVIPALSHRAPPRDHRRGLLTDRSVPSHASWRAAAMSPTPNCPVST